MAPAVPRRFPGQELLHGRQAALEEQLAAGVTEVVLAFVTVGHVGAVVFALATEAAGGYVFGEV
mgnify:CR=1 FL=1